MAFFSGQSLYHQLNPFDDGRTYKTDQANSIPGDSTYTAPFYTFGTGSTTSGNGAGGGGGGGWGDTGGNAPDNSAVNGANTGGSYYGSSGSGGSAPAYNAEDLAYVDDQMNLLRGMYGNIDIRQNQGLQGLEDKYGENVSNVNLSRGRAIEDLNTKTRDTQMAKERAISNVDTQARTLAESLRRRLGMASGSDSSAYQITAPGAVARDASGKRTGVLEDYGVNFRNLDMTKKRAEEDYGRELKSLEAQKRSNTASLLSGIDEQRQAIDQKLAEYAAERAKIQGGGYGAQRIASQPYVDQYNQRQAAINSLFDKYRNPYSVKPVVVNTPQLKDYTVDRTQLDGTRNQDEYAPYTNYLRKPDDEEQKVGY